MIELSPWVPILGAPITTALGAIAVAVVNKKRERADPLDQATKLMGQLQSDREADRKESREMRTELRDGLAEANNKIDGLYEQVGQWRGYGTAWELWHADGMPNPPGPPKRPTFTN